MSMHFLPKTKFSSIWKQIFYDKGSFDKNDVYTKEVKKHFEMKKER